jgi:hypothetical protein
VWCGVVYTVHGGVGVSLFVWCCVYSVGGVGWGGVGVVGGVFCE